jgi:phosphate transport system substrate-binding protein
MNMANTVRNFFGIIFLSCSLLSCSLFNKKEEVKDGPAQGEISIAVDESFQLLLKSEKTAFENNYHFARINLKFRPENEAVADLLNKLVIKLGVILMVRGVGSCLGDV